MTMPTPLTGTFQPTALVRRDGSLGIDVIRFHGLGGLTDRHAEAAGFTWRATRRGEERTLLVAFSYHADLYDPSTFGLPDAGSREANRVQFALAAIGDYLDAEGEPPKTVMGEPAFEIKCLSYNFDDWKARVAHDDGALERYIEARLFWSWKFGHPATTLDMHDMLRVGATPDDLARILLLGEPTRHTRMRRFDGDPRVTATPALINDWRQRLEESASPAAPPPPPSLQRPSFVDPSRIAALRALPTSTFDFQRLVRLCEELNECWADDCYQAVAALTRAVLDHVPPVFGFTAFREVANNYGTQSFKKQMNLLEDFSRKVADAVLHTPIRRKESVPSAVQVNCAQALDVLLAEVVRIDGGPPK